MPNFTLYNQIVATVSRQLSWSHVVLLCQMDEEIKRDFYLQMACIEHWGVRTLREKMGSMLFERTVISKQPEEVIKYELKKLAQTQQLTPEFVFRDPCFLDFIGLNTKYAESDLENAILDHEELELSMLCLHLLQLSMVYINTVMLQQVFKESSWLSIKSP